MNDYLARLAGRIRHASPVLHPLLPSFFESTITGIATWPKMEQSAVQYQPVAAREAAKIVPISDVRQSSSGVSDDQAEKREPEDPMPTYASEILKGATNRQGVAPRTPDSVELSESSASSHDVAPEQFFRSWPEERRASESREFVHPVSRNWDTTPPSPQLARPEPEIAGPAVPPAQSSPSHTAKQIASSEPIRPSPFLEQARSSLKLQPLVALGEPAHPHVQRPRGVEAATSALPVSITRRLGEIQTKLASPLPTAPEIHVTIGRIEVRAVSSPASIRREPPPSKPELSLDDYLRLRNQGTV